MSDHGKDDMGQQDDRKRETDEQLGPLEAVDVAVHLEHIKGQLRDLLAERFYQDAFAAIMTGRNQEAALVLRDLTSENLTELTMICGDVQVMVKAEQRRRAAEDTL